MAIMSVLITVAINVAVAAIVVGARALLAPPQQRSSPVRQPSIPRPADGKFNFKQSVPSLAVVLGGPVKKGSDYVLLEERQGVAWHVMVWAAHRIDGFLDHYLHDEMVTVVGGSVTAPAHFVYAGIPYVSIETKAGLDAETAFGHAVTYLPEIWTADHRGDGLAQVKMTCTSINQENYLNMYPQQMPVHTAVGNGALLYDPREESHDPDDHNSWEFSANLALMRLRHLTHPWGGKLNLADMYLPDWIVAANVADETVANREDEEEPRYHGALWFRYENDQVEVGRKIDEAGELLLYERPDGKIGVHAGRLVTPDIRITKADLLSFRYDANRRRSTTVLAVRGRFTDPDEVFNTVDAAIFGDPYIGGEDTQRTDTVDNEAVLRHNHIQRLQKLRYIRANAPRVTFTVDLIDKGDAEDRRFVRLHHPERGLDEAIIEITGRPTISLKELTLTLEGIVVPATLYSFNAATDEGTPGGAVDSIVPGGVPEPENFAIAIGSEIVTGGQSGAFAVASWDFLSDALTYELEYQLSDESEVPRTATSRPGEIELRTEILRDGAEYRFRLRAVSNGAVSDWTGYETATATADTSPPGQPTGFDSSEAGGDVTLVWVNPNSPNLYKTELYRGSTASFGSAVLIQTFYGGIAEPRGYVDAGLASGTYYWWARSFNASGVPSLQVGPESETI